MLVKGHENEKKYMLKKKTKKLMLNQFSEKKNTWESNTTKKRLHKSI